MSKSKISVTLLQSMGTDDTVVDAARISFDKRAEQYTDEKNHKLIEYLAKNGHWTPFAHCQATFHVKAPIFVARQLVKHQVGLVWNEVSRRYVDEEPKFFYPNLWRERPPFLIKQGSGPSFQNTELVNEGMSLCMMMHDYYEKLLDNNIAPEQARIFLPINVFTEWHWTGSLMAWSRVCNLRCTKDAQMETRTVATLINSACLDLWPVSWKALMT